MLERAQSDAIYCINISAKNVSLGFDSAALECRSTLFSQLSAYENTNRDVESDRVRLTFVCTNNNSSTLHFQVKHGLSFGLAMSWLAFLDTIGLSRPKKACYFTPN